MNSTAVVAIAGFAAALLAGVVAYRKGYAAGRKDGYASGAANATVMQGVMSMSPGAVAVPGI